MQFKWFSFFVLVLRLFVCFVRLFVLSGNNTYVNVTSYLGQPAFFVRQPLPEASWVERFRASLNELGVLNVP